MGGPRTADTHVQAVDEVVVAVVVEEAAALKRPVVHSIVDSVAFVADLVAAEEPEPAQVPVDTAVGCILEGPPAGEAGLVDNWC